MEATFFPYFIAFGWIGLFLLIGVFLRSKIKLFQKTLLPASLIGGLLGLVCINLGIIGTPTTNGWMTLSPQVFGVLTFHLFAFGFVGIGLIETKQETSGKTIVQGALWICILFTFFFALQSLVGFGVFEVWKNMFGGDYDSILGYLLGAGFTQGPGQAAAYGTVWEMGYQTTNAIGTGLAFAAAGFLVAGLVGVWLADYGVKKGWVSLGENKIIPDYVYKGIMPKDNHPANSFSTTYPSNIDSFALHLGLVFFIYLLAYCFGVFWAYINPPSLAPMGIGMVFAWGMFISMLARLFMGKLKIKHLLDQETCRRITGATVDLMICAVFMGIDIPVLMQIIAPYLISIFIVTIITLLVCIWAAKHTKEFGFYRGLTTFGICTGTVASGLLLLRIIDPDFDTPVAVEAGLYNVFAMLFFLPISLSIPLAPTPGFPIFWIFLAVVVAAIPLMFLMRLLSPKKVF